MRNPGPNFHRAFKFALLAILSVCFLITSPSTNAGLVVGGSESLHVDQGDASVDSERPKRRKRRKKRKKKRKPARERWIQHEIAPGETLGAIARNYDVRVKQLKRWNKISADNDNIYAGRKLRIKTGTTKSGRTRVEYVVQRGDSYWKIATHHGATVADRKKLIRTV